MSRDHTSHDAVSLQATLHAQPYPYATLDQPLDRIALATLDALFDEPLPWVRHETFYQCFLCEVTERVPPTLRATLARYLRDLTGLPLRDTTTVTVQRMEPGDQALPHTDRPLLGFEAARLILQLDGRGTGDEGGVFRVHPDPDGHLVAMARPPSRGQAVAFALRLHAHHSVTPTGTVRRTVVFHAQHRGNDDHVAAFLEQSFADLRFDALPSYLDEAIALAESTLPDERTDLAARVAWRMHQWGTPQALVEEGYALTLRAESYTSAPWPIALACWLAELHRIHFDLDTWAVLAGRAAPSATSAIREAWEVCFGRALSSSEAATRP